MSPFKAFPHQPVNTPTARAGQPPNRGMDSLPEVLHHCKTTSNRIVQKWPVLLGGEMANLKKNTREGLSHHTHVVSKYLESLSFLFSKNRLGNLPLNTGERLLGWRMRTWEWHDSDTPCHLGASFDEVHRKAFAALQWAKVWSATMGLGAFFSSFEGDGLMMFDAKKCFVLSHVLVRLLDVPNTHFSVDLTSEIWCYLLYQDGTDDVIIYLSWFFLLVQRSRSVQWKIPCCYHHLEGIHVLLLLFDTWRQRPRVFAPHKGPKQIGPMLS